MLKNINFTRDERIFDVTRMLNEYEKNKMSSLFKDDKMLEASETPTENDEDDELTCGKEDPANARAPSQSSSLNDELKRREAEEAVKKEVTGSKLEIDALKQEWSSMFMKLESDYKLKLEEQQMLNDLKLKTLHEEIKKSILEQQDIIISKQKQQVKIQLSISKDNANLVRKSLFSRKSRTDLKRILNFDLKF